MCIRRLILRRFICIIKDMKRRSLKKIQVFVLVAAICVLFLTVGAGYRYTYKAVVGFSLYAETDLTSEVLLTVPQNAQVECVGEPVEVDDLTWQKIRYNGKEGYTLKNHIFVSNKNDNYTFLAGKAKSRAMGESIPLYLGHSDPQEAVGFMNDGERLSIVQDGIGYGDYVRIEYNGTYYFVHGDEVTTGLCYNETLAIIIIGSIVAAAAIGLTIFFLIRRRKKQL